MTQSMPQSADLVFDRIVALLRSKMGTTANVTQDTEILRDLNLWGDDAGDFFDAYVREFGLDMSDLRFTDYFPQEGEHVGLLVKRLVTGRKTHERYLPIRISDLVDFAMTGKWKQQS